MSDYNGWKVELEEAQARIRELDAALEEADRQAKKLEALVEKVVAWEGEGPTHAIVPVDLLDECERALESAINRCSICNDTGVGYTCPECYDANSTLNKLRAQERD